MEMREALQEKEDAKGMKAKQREKVTHIIKKSNSLLLAVLQSLRRPEPVYLATAGVVTLARLLLQLKF